MKILCTLLILLSGVVAPAAAQSMDSSSRPLAQDDPVFTTIMTLERERMQAYVEQDLEYLASSFAEEYLHTNLVGGTTTKQQELDFYGTSDFTLESGDVGPFRMHQYSDVVVATGQVSWTGARYRNADLSGDFRVSRVYVLRDGKWLLATSHASKIGG